MRYRLPIFLSLGLFGCAAVPATPAQLAAAEQRLLQPFLEGTEVGCRELLVEYTGNFHNHVAQPAVDVKAHLARKERGDGYVDTIWTNRLGDTKSPFVMFIGAAPDSTEPGVQRGPRTTFTVLNEVRLRIYEDARPLTLTARAGGGLVVVRHKGAATAVDCAEFRIADGTLTIRR